MVATDVSDDLSRLRKSLKLLGEAISLTMHSVSDNDPELAQKKFNFREMQHQMLALCDQYEVAYAAVIEDRQIDRYLDRSKLIRDGIDRINARLEFQATKK